MYEKIATKVSEMKENYKYENRDCLDGMKEYPDNYFDLAIVDPPYGLGAKLTNGSNHKGGKLGNKIRTKSALNGHRPFSMKNGERWDIRPPQEYFDELFRVSKNQIIWGANHFTLPETESFIIWDKLQVEDISFSMCEYAWYSGIDRPQIYREVPPRGDHRFHPTQKPIKLYRWILKHYAKEGFKILDTHVGSASSIIAAIDMGFEIYGFELDKEYFDLSMKRIKDFESQLKLDWIVREQFINKFPDLGFTNTETILK